ncbi:MAG: outer membrane beta-barrel protein [Flavobacteriaceae bacterium]
MKTPQFLIALLFFLGSFSNQAQFEFGVHAGINSNATGNIQNAQDEITSLSKSNTGYFVGGYLEAKIAVFYIRPELQLAKYKSTYESGNYETSKLEAPVSLGYTVLPGFSIYAGPSFHYILDQKSSLQLGDLKTKSTVGSHFGVRLNMGPFGISLRYEKGLTPNDVALLNASELIGDRLDTRNNLWALGISYKLAD